MVSQMHCNLHIRLDQSQPLVYVSLGFVLILFYQDRTDKFIDFIFWSQLRKLLREHRRISFEP